MKKHPTAGAHLRARTLRHAMTDTEKAVWRLLRSRQIAGHRFRRQVPFGQYIVDFACHEARVIVEIDGGQHDPSSPEEIKRSRFLESEGYRILRFWNNDVLESLEGVWTTIAAALAGTHPLPTLPHQGGGPSPAQATAAPSCEWRGFAGLSTEELYEVLRFRQAIFVVEQASPYPDLDGLDERAQHLLMRVDGMLAGYLRVIAYPTERRIAIGRVAVAAAMRRQGLARRLMLEALGRARRDHADWAVTLSAQTYLILFYETLGFRATSSPYDDYGVPHVDMALVGASR